MCIDWESKGTVPFKEVLKGRRWWKHAEWTGLDWEVSEMNSNNSISVGLSGKVISFKGHLKTRIVSFSWELHFYFGWLAKSEMCTYIQSCITQHFQHYKNISLVRSRLVWGWVIPCSLQTVCHFLLFLCTWWISETENTS